MPLDSLFPLYCKCDEIVLGVWLLCKSPTILKSHNWIHLEGCLSSRKYLRSPLSVIIISILNLHFVKYASRRFKSYECIFRGNIHDEDVFGPNDPCNLEYCHVSWSKDLRRIKLSLMWGAFFRFLLVIFRNSIKIQSSSI